MLRICDVFSTDPDPWIRNYERDPDCGIFVSDLQDDTLEKIFLSVLLITL